MPFEVAISSLFSLNVSFYNIFCLTMIPERGALQAVYFSRMTWLFGGGGITMKFGYVLPLQ